MDGIAGCDFVVDQVQRTDKGFRDFNNENVIRDSFAQFFNYSFGC